MVEPLVTEAFGITMFGPRLVSEPQSVIRVAPVAHQIR